MSRSSLRTRLVSTIAAGALGIAGFAVLGPSPASATPGDAAAVGIDAALDVQLAPGAVDASVDGSLGAVNAPPTATAHLVDAALGSAPATVTASVIDTAASSTPSESSAISAVTGAQVVIPALTPVLGGVLVDTGADVIRATATCPTGGTPTASVDPIAGILVAGQAVTVDANGDAEVLLALAGIPVGDVSLHLQDTITTSNTAAAVAVELTFAVNVPAVASVTGSVTIARASCESSVVTSTVPAATDIDPDHGPTAGGTLVTITGTAFVPDDTSVTIGGITVPAADVDVDPTGTSLTFATPAHAAGLVEVTVTTPGGTSPALAYTYDPPVTAVAPTATGILPDQGPTAGGTPVTITGTGFVAGDTSVTIGGITVPAAQVTVLPGGLGLTFATPPHAAGPVDVSVTTPAGTSTPPLAFTYVAPPVTLPPVATTIDPDQGPTTGGTSVTITGTGFVAGDTSVTIGGTTVPATQVNVTNGGTSLTFVTPAHTAGPVGVTATTSGGTTAPLTFTYVAPDDGGPTAGTIDPDHGPTTGGTTVTVTGTGFVPGDTTVTIGGIIVPAGQVNVTDDGTSLTFPTPAHAAGPVPVIVTTSGGTTARSPTPTSPPRRRTTATATATTTATATATATATGPRARSRSRPPTGPWPGPAAMSSRWPTAAWPWCWPEAHCWSCAAA